MAREAGATRRPQNQLKNAAVEYLKSIGGGPASITQIADGIRPDIGDAPQSSYRSSLQDTRLFERVSRGVFKLRTQ